MNKEKNQETYISILSTISAISVVFLHTNGVFWEYSNDNYWFFANIIECIFYFAVPVFFMIIGATLINYRDRYSTKTFFKKRALKTFIPFIFWSLIALLFRIFVSKTIDINELNFQYIFNGIFNTKFMSIYWFFTSLFCIYLSIPLFASIKEEWKNEVFLYIAILSFTLNCLLPFLNKVFNLDLYTPITVTVGSGFLLYVILGYLIHNNIFNKTFEYMIYLLGFFGFIMHVVGTYILSTNSLRIVDTYKGYNNVPCIFYSIAIFVFFKMHYKVLSDIIIKFLLRLKDYTFSIYVVHMFILEMLTSLFNLNKYLLIYSLGLPFIIIPICVLIAYAFRNIIFLRKMLPK